MNTRPRMFLSAIVIAFGLGFAGYLIQEGLVMMKAMDRYVTVKGLAERETKADKAIWRLQFSYAHDELSAAYQGIEGSQKKIQEFLTSKGFKVEEVQLEPISVTDNEGSGYSQSNKIKRYNASAAIVLTTNNIDLVRNTLQQTGSVVQAGILLTSSEVHFLFTKLNDIKPDMLNLATANAKDAANAFAKNSGSTLGEIRQASQGLFTVQNANDDYGDNDPNKKVRVVTTVQYYLK